MSLGQASPDQYLAQLEQKRIQIENQFSRFTNNLNRPPKINVFPSPPTHFRMRAEFKVWQKENTAHYAMYEPGKYKQAVVLEEFTIGSLTITEIMKPLMAEINVSQKLRQRLFQIEFLSSSRGELLVTLIYHKKLDDEWENLAKPLEEKFGCHIIGRSRGQKCILSQDFITETFTLNEGKFHYQQVETGFTQPNAAVCQKMLQWACDVSKNIGGDLLELYCGNGNFTLPLAKNFERVLATEVSKTSVNSALYNIALNQADNIKIVRLSSEEFTQAINNVRPFRRLKDIDLTDYSFSTLFVDPPRAGLDKDTCELASQFDNILYVSCNPDTLEENLNSLSISHSIEHIALFDQFPYTQHCECGVLLRKR